MTNSSFPLLSAPRNPPHHRAKTGFSRGRGKSCEETERESSRGKNEAGEENARESEEEHVEPGGAGEVDWGVLNGWRKVGELDRGAGGREGN